MKLTPELKQRIDDYFDNLTGEDLQKAFPGLLEEVIDKEITTAYLIPENISEYTNPKTGDHNRMFSEIEIRDYKMLDKNGVNWYSNNIYPPDTLSLLGTLYPYGNNGCRKANILGELQ